MASVLAEGLQERLQAIELLAAALETSAGTAAPVALQALGQLQRIGPVFAWAGVTDPQGVVLQAVPGLLVGQNVGQRPWFQGAVRGPYTGDVHQAKLLAAHLPPAADGGPPRFVDFAAPVKAADGRLLGVVGAHGSWDWAGQVVRNLKSPRASDQGVQVFILDRAGRVLHRPSAVSPSPPGDTSTPRPDRPAVVTWPDGERYFTAVAPLVTRSEATDLGWQVVSRQPETLALEAASQARAISLALGVVAALLTTALAWLLTARLTQPLSDIARAAQRIEAGDLSARLPNISGSGEMVQLSSALQGMTHALMDGQTALKQAKMLGRDRFIP